MMGSGMSGHEWRGPHIWQEKIEALEKENAVLKAELRDLNAMNEALSQANTDICNQLAALKAQEPVAWGVFHLDGSAHIFQQKETAQAFGGVVPLFTTPQPQDKDGERYRWLTLTSDSNKLMVIDVLTQRLYFGYEADEAIDAAMKESK